MNTQNQQHTPSKNAELAAKEIAPVLIDVSDLATMLNISTRTVWRLLSAGKMLAPIRIGGAVRWRYQEVHRWIEQGCPEPPQH